MGLISQQIPVITGGVSQEPQARRSSSRAQESVNTLLSHSRRIRKRPPIKHLKKIDLGIEFRTIAEPVQGADGASVSSANFLVNAGDFVWVDVGWGTPATALTSVKWDTTGVNEDLVQLSSMDTGLGRKTEVWASQFTDSLTPKTAVFTATFAGAVDNPVIRVFSLKGVAAEPYGVSDQDNGADADTTLSTALVSAARRVVITSVLEVNSAPTLTATSPDTVVVDQDSTTDWGLTLLTTDGIASTVVSGTYSGNPGGFHAFSLELLPLAIPVTDVATFDVAGQTYLVVFSGGDLRVFNATTGAESDVVVPDVEGLSYLQGATEYRTVAVGDSLFVVNKEKTVVQRPEVSPVPDFEAWVTVNTGVAGATYTVKVGNFTFTHAVAPGATLDDTRTDVIAEELTTAMAAAFPSFFFFVERDGSTIKITSSPDAPDLKPGFEVTASDGLGDTGMTVVKNSVRRFEDLPQKLVADGSILEVEGSDISPFDNYFVRFTKPTDALVKRGIWKECVSPGSLLRLDRITMPHRLQFQGSLFSDATHDGEGEIPQLSDSTLPQVAWQFDPAAVYPAGMHLRWVLVDEATTTEIEFEYDVSASADETGATVATGLATLINAHADYIASSPSSGLLQVERADAADFGGGPAQEFNTDAFHNALMNLFPDSLDGKTIRNVTTGATAEILSNTVTSIIHEDLAGGERNYWLPGDVAEVLGAGNFFVFGPCPWKDREAGNDTSVPFPSFVGKTIEDIYLYEGRLGILSAGSNVLSRSGDLFNLFKQSAIDVRSDDPIDITNALPDSTGFHSARNWRGTLVLFSEDAQYRFTGSPILSPQSVSLTQLSSYKNSPDVPPVVSGDKLFFISTSGGDLKLVEYQIPPASEQLPKAIDLTEHIPTYIEGTPIEITADDTLGLLFLLTDVLDGRALYVCSYRDLDDERGERAWCRWEFPIGLELIGGLTISRGSVGVVGSDNTGAFVHSLTLNGTDPLLDRLISSESADVSVEYDALEDETTWTLPYSLAVDGSEGVLVAADVNGNTFNTTRPAVNQIRMTGDVSASVFVFGVRYSMAHTLSTIYQRRRDTGEAETRGRLQLRYLDVSFEDTNRFFVTVTPDGRNAQTTIFFSEVLDPPVSNADGKLRVPILCRNDKATIVLEDGGETIKPFLSLTQLDWSGFYTAIGSRL